MITIEDMVRREVGHCVSSLVSTLALGGHGAMRHNGGTVRNPRLSYVAPLMELADQAAELCAPVLDYEGAARQEGWIPSPYESACFIKRIENTEDEGPAETDASLPDAWERLCAELAVEPYEWEVYEHWIVSDWLADKLAAQGERVDTDFAGLCVWGRTTTGQGIASDSVIQRIYKELVED